MVKDVNIIECRSVVTLALSSHTLSHGLMAEMDEFIVEFGRVGE